MYEISCPLVRCLDRLWAISEISSNTRHDCSFDFDLSNVTKVHKGGPFQRQTTYQVCKSIFTSWPKNTVTAVKADKDDIRCVSRWSSENEIFKIIRFYGFFSGKKCSLTATVKKKALQFHSPICPPYDRGIHILKLFFCSTIEDNTSVFSFQRKTAIFYTECALYMVNEDEHFCAWRTFVRQVQRVLENSEIMQACKF